MTGIECSILLNEVTPRSKMLDPESESAKEVNVELPPSNPCYSEQASALAVLCVGVNFQ